MQYLCSEFRKRRKVMALSINSIPVLYGVAAERFEAAAEENANRPMPRLAVEAEERLDSFIAKSKQFVF